jgi:acetyl-CoA synthetase
MDRWADVQRPFAARQVPSGDHSDVAHRRAKIVTTLTCMTEAHTDVPALYPPSAAFAHSANATAELYDRADADRLAFWSEQANRLTWDTPFTEVLDWSGAPVAKWFVGGKLNVAYNCVDRHVEAGNGDRVAIHWEGEPVGDERTITYAELKDEVCRAANALTRRSWRCWPVPDWASCTRWCSADTPLRPCGPGSRTPKPNW